MTIMRASLWATAVIACQFAAAIAINSYVADASPVPQHGCALWEDSNGSEVRIDPRRPG
jgi:hypothetical protein